MNFMYKVVYGEESCRKTRYFMTLIEAEQFVTQMELPYITVGTITEGTITFGLNI